MSTGEYMASASVSYSGISPQHRSEESHKSNP